MDRFILVSIYGAFLLFGLPYTLLGAGWPVIQAELGIPLGYVGIIQMLISAGPVVSSMFSSMFLERYGIRRLLVIGFGVIAVTLLGFSAAASLLWLILAAIPFGIGYGFINTGINSYVAHHYKSQHMSWLHALFGIGALGGPLLLSVLLLHGHSWRLSYQGVVILQLMAIIILIVSKPIWDRAEKDDMDMDSDVGQKPVRLHKVFRIPGVRPALLVFFFYGGTEASVGLWGASYLFKTKGMTAAAAAVWVSVFFASVTAGRIIVGFLSGRLTNNAKILLGAIIVFSGLLLMILPLPIPAVLAGIILIGLGYAPIIPSMLHETPVRFGKVNSPSILGIQMVMVAIGATLLPFLFGFIAGMNTSARLSLLPWFILLCHLLVCMSFIRLTLITRKEAV